MEKQTTKQKHHISVSLRSQILIDIIYNLCFHIFGDDKTIPETFLSTISVSTRGKTKAKKALITVVNDLPLTEKEITKFLGAMLASTTNLWSNHCTF